MEIQVFNDIADQENSGVQTRHAKRVDNQPATKRTALGVVNSLRQQPSRAAKNAPFKVFEDVENIRPAAAGRDVNKKVKTSKRPSNNVALSSIADANSNVQVVKQSKPSIADEEAAFDVAMGSPMVLDVSCMETSETPSTEAPIDPELALFCLHEYQEDIHSHLRESELKLRPKLNYMRKQTDISPQMRTILIDWLVEVGEEYKLHDETLHLAVNYIDRFLSQMSVLRGKLQLVGTACMFIASKYEEIYPPDVGEFVYITDDTYTKKQLLRMEHLVIKVLNFDVAVPTANVFLDMYCRQLDVDQKLKCLAQYIMELSLLDCDNYLVYRPSVISSSALFLASHIVTSAPLISELEKVTRYAQSELAACIQKMLVTLRTAHEQPQQAVREKYKADSRKAVALIPVPDLI